MSERNELQRWIPALILSALIVFAALNEILLLCLALTILPIAAAVLAYTGGWMQVTLVCGAAAMATGFCLPIGALWLVLPWCLLSGCIALVKVKKRLTRPLLWAGLILASWAVTLFLLNQAFEGQLIHGLAQSVCDEIDRHPQRNTILLNAYSVGLSRLDETGSLSSLAFVLMPEATKLQLLYSLRVSLEEILPNLLCESIVYHTAITVLLCTLLPDWRRRKHGEKGVFPPPEEWYIPRGLGLAISALCLGWVVATLSSGGVDMYLGLLCLAVFKTAYLIQGVCLLLWLERRMGIRSVMRNIWAVILSLIAPIVPIIMGLIDQRKDSRHLRPEEEVNVQ